MDQTLPATRRARIEEWLTPAALRDVLFVSAVAVAVVVWLMLVLAGGWEYYRTPMRVRAYADGHAMLRPSGWLGHGLGVAGLLMMGVPVVYSLRKKWRALARLGQLRHWLNVHIFCGIVGPVLVTFHAALKFNGLISVAYWSMVLVVLSGFVGRYLYVRMPRTIRGVEMGYEEILTRANALQAELLARRLEPSLVESLLAGGDAASRRRARRGLVAAGVAPVLAREAVQLARERTFLLRRLRYLERTRRLFAMWHVFHQPLVYLMFVIAALHISLALYLGYGLFPW